MIPQALLRKGRGTAFVVQVSRTSVHHPSLRPALLKSSGMH